MAWRRYTAANDQYKEKINEQEQILQVDAEEEKTKSPVTIQSPAFWREFSCVRDVRISFYQTPVSWYCSLYTNSQFYKNNIKYHQMVIKV